MTEITVLGSAAAIIVAVITIWNTAPVRGLSLRIRVAVLTRRARKAQRERVERFAAEPRLQEIEDRFDELVAAYRAKSIPDCLGALWSDVYRLAGAAPVGAPFQYGTLVIHRDMGVITIERGPVSITGGVVLNPRLIRPRPLP